jgi:hypothetical protein
MSRGPGRWQRAILDELNYRAPYVVVDDLLRELVGDRPTRSQKNAMYRATLRLVNDETLESAYICRQCGTADGWWEAAACCASEPQPSWDRSPASDAARARWRDHNRPGGPILRFPPLSVAPPEQEGSREGRNTYGDEGADDAS